MQCFCPMVRTISYVDNILVLAAQTFALATAFCTLQTFLELWGLALDLDKSYSCELGGSLAFTAGCETRTFSQRFYNTDSKWPKLSRSPVPLQQKIAVIPQVFWAKSLHGSSGSVLSDKFIQSLRTKAMRSLGLQRAGASPILRLSLSRPPRADPGYFQ